MTAEQIKQIWTNISDDCLSQVIAINDLLEAREKRTSLERISCIYLYLFIAGFSCAILFAVSAFTLQAASVPPVVWKVLCMFMLIAALCDFILYRKVKKINLFTMKVVQVATAAKCARKLHFIFQGLLLLLSIPVLVLLFSSLPDGDNGFVASGIMGGVIGLAIGITVFIKLMKNYSRVIRKD